MREWCSCGAAIRARYSRIKEWRTQHHCPDRPANEPEPQGTVAIVEQADEPSGHFDGMRYFPTIQARIGFTPNEG